MFGNSRRNEAPFLYRKPILDEKATDLIYDGGTFADEALTDTMCRLKIQLLVGAYGHEAYRRAAHGLGDGRSIIEVVLLCAQVGLDEFWRHQPYIMTQALKGTGKVLRTWTRLHTDQASRKVGNELHELAAVELVSDDRLAHLVASDQMKPGLTDIDPERLDLHDALSDIGLWGA
jgi:hypothetical protein